MSSLPAILLAAEALPPAPAAAATWATGSGTLLTLEPQVRRLVHRLLGWPSAQDVEDVVQEVLLSAWRHRTSFRGDASVATWLFRIAVRKAQGHARWAAVRRRWFGAPAIAGDHLPAPTADCPSELADDVRAVRSAMAGLSHRDREVLVLRYLENRGVDEVAALLGISRAATDARLSRARARLRSVLGVGAGEEAS